MTAHVKPEGCPLTPAQINVVKWLADGKTAQDIADIEGVGIKGVQSHISRALVAAGAAKSTSLVAMALRKGWIV